MNQELILSTKGKNKFIKPFMGLFTVIFSLVGIFTVYTTITKILPLVQNDTEKMATLGFTVIGFIFILVSCITLTMLLNYSKTYVNIYSDRIEGVGIYNINMNYSQFSLKAQDITTVTVNGIFVKIHTNALKYSISMDKETAQKVFQTINQIK